MVSIAAADRSRRSSAVEHSQRPETSTQDLYIRAPLKFYV